MTCHISPCALYEISKNYLKSLMMELRSSCIECCSNPLNEPRELQHENIKGVCSA